jgi:hypothetical protein
MPLCLVAVWRLIKSVDALLLLSPQVFWGGDGPNDKGLSRKHIIEGTKVTLHLAVTCGCSGL